MQCAQRTQAADSGGPADRWAQPESGGSGAAEGWCGTLQATQQAAGPEAGARQPGRVPRPAPPRAPVRGAAPARPGVSSARTPPGPGPASSPPRGPPPQPWRPRRQPPPAPRLTSAALRTDGRTDGPGQQAPRRAGARGARHRRSSERAAAAASRRAPLRSPITQRPGPASRAAARGGRECGRPELGDEPAVAAAADGSGSDSRWRLPRRPPSDCPASVLAKLRPQPPAPDTAPSPAAVRHLGPSRRPRLTREAANRDLELGAAGQSQGEPERGWGEELQRCPGASWWPGRPRGCGGAELRGWGGPRPESPPG